MACSHWNRTLTDFRWAWSSLQGFISHFCCSNMIVVMTEVCHSLKCYSVLSIWYWISRTSEMKEKFYIASHFWLTYRRYFQLFAENGFVWENLHLNRLESKSRGPLGGVKCHWFKELLAGLSKMLVVSNSSKVCTLSLPDGAVAQCMVVKLYLLRV